MKPRSSRIVVIVAIVAIFLVTVVSCMTLPSDDPYARIPTARAHSDAGGASVTLTVGSYEWSHWEDGVENVEEMHQVEPQEWSADELASLDLAAPGPVTVGFGASLNGAQVLAWDEGDLEPEESDDILGTVLFWRARPLLDRFEMPAGTEVPATIGDDEVTFDAEPGRRYAVTAELDTSSLSEGSGSVEYVLTVG